jgi:hypothetical protein
MKRIALLLALLGLTASASPTIPFGFWKKAAATTDLIAGTQPKYRWDYHSLSSGTIGDWVDMSNSVHLVQTAGTTLTNSTSTGVYFGPGTAHYTNAIAITLTMPWTLVEIFKAYDVSNSGELYTDSDTTFHALLANATITSGAVLTAVATNVQYSFTFAVNADTSALTYTNGVSTGIGGLFQNNRALVHEGGDIFGDTLNGSVKAILVYTNQISLTDVSNINYQVQNQGF